MTMLAVVPAWAEAGMIGEQSRYAGENGEAAGERGDLRTRGYRDVARANGRGGADGDVGGTACVEILLTRERIDRDAGAEADHAG